MQQDIAKEYRYNGYKIIKNENEPARSSCKWVVVTIAGDWVYEAATKRECVAWTKK